jgi:lipoprotein-anchoring transpeptidase ErfK/SrfK
MRILLVVATVLLAAACVRGGQTAAVGPTPPSSVTSSAAAPSSEPPAPTTTETAPPPQLAPPRAPAQVPGTPCEMTNGACVSLSSQQTWLITDGAVTYGPVPITSGRPGHETPPGTFAVQHKVRDEVSREFNNAPMPYSVYFADGGIAFHEGSLEVPSHGCVHLSHEAAVTYFEALSQGARVQVVG